MFISDTELIPLFSGSSGNSVLVRVCGFQFLVDIGQSCKRVEEALLKVGTTADDIDALFITHSHSDHIKGVDVFVRKHPLPIYATAPTMNAILKTCTKPHDAMLDKVIDSREILMKSPVCDDDDVRIDICETPHDAYGSVCYKFSSESKKKSLMVMTDLGYVTEEIRAMATGVSGILVEANYDPDMLENGPYDYVLRRRVAGPRGHLSNYDSAEIIKYLIDHGTTEFMLGHLSENNNIPDLAYETIVSVLRKYQYENDTHYHLKVAKRYEVSDFLKV